MRRSLARVRGEALAEGARWVSPGNYHVTMHFLGEVAPAELHHWEEKGGQAASLGAPGSLEVGGLGYFPHAKKPRVLWAGLEGEPKLMGALSAVASRLGTTDWSPHITLARFPKGLPKQWASQLEPLQDFHWGVMAVDRLVLMQSTIGAAGPSYEVLREWKFEGT